jgi:hypothetical protein
MRRILIAIAAIALFASPAHSYVNKKQEKALQRRESGGEAATQVQRGGLKRDRRITHRILRSEKRHAHSAPHRMHTGTHQS